MINNFMKIRELFETATAGATSSGNVSIGTPIYRNSPVKANKKKDGTVKNALDSNVNLITGGSIVVKRGSKLAESISNLLEIVQYIDKPSVGNWDIRVSKKPVVVPKITGSNPQFVAKVTHSRRENIIIYGTGNSQDDAIQNAMAKTTDDGGRTADPDQFKSFTADLNVDFTRDLHSDDDATPFFKFVKRGNGVFLVRASEDYYRAFGNEITSLGFRKATGRLLRIGTNATQIYGFPISRKEVKTLGLIPNGRYVLDKDYDDEDGNAMFSMHYDSRSLGSHDKYRMSKPGITISGTLAN